MILITSICVAVVFAVSVYLLLGRELKGIAMGAFLMTHAANLCIIAMSGSPIAYAPGVVAGQGAELKGAPVVETHEPVEQPLAVMVDPLPQALILTAIVIGFGMMGFLLALIVVTGRRTGTLEVRELAEQGLAETEESASSPAVRDRHDVETAAK